MPIGPRLSMTDPLTPKPAISDVILNMDWQEAPLLRILKFDRSNLRKVRISGVMATQLSWLTDTNSPTVSALADAVAAADTTIDVSAGTGQFFRQGDIIAVHAPADPAAPLQPPAVAEYMLVTGVDVDELAVLRPWNPAFPAAAHAQGAQVTIYSRAMPEAATFTTGHTTTVTTESNCMQILSQAVTVSKTAMAIDEYGVDDRMAYEIAKLFNNGGSAGVLAQRLENTFYHGARVVRTGVPGTVGEYGGMGGFDTFVNPLTVPTGHIKDLRGGPLQRSDIHDVLRSIRVSNGACTHLLGGAWAMEKITGMYDGYIETTREETVGGSEIKAILTPHGKVKLIYDWMCPEDRLFFIKPAVCGWVPLRPFEARKIEEVRDAYSTDIVGEYTFVLSGPRNFGVINNVGVGI